MRTYVTIVSGMPRSGTSLMMRMLDAGGIPALTDGIRAADLHNPHGYFEDERARRLARDSAWIEEGRGKAVKIIYRLLPHLPSTHDYRILFMVRDLNEIYASQQDMLKARNDPAAAQDRSMIHVLSQELAAARKWLGMQPNVRYLPVAYAALIGEPSSTISQIVQFLDGGLDEQAMARVIDPALYRHRSHPQLGND